MEKCRKCGRPLTKDELVFGLCPNCQWPWSPLVFNTTQLTIRAGKEMKATWNDIRTNREQRRAIHNYLDVIRTSTGENREKAKKAILRIGQPAAKHLCDALKGGNKDLVIQIVPLIGETGDHTCIPYLQKLDKSDPEVAAVVDLAIGKLCEE